MIYKSSISKWTILQHIDTKVYPEFEGWEPSHCPICQKQFSATPRKYNCNIKNWMIHMSLKHRRERAVMMLEKLLMALIFTPETFTRYTEEEFENKIRALRPELEEKLDVKK